MSTKQDISTPEIQRLIEKQTPVVEKIARSLARRTPENVECDDLIQDGMLGLINAILRWTRETTGCHFENYVAQRAHGAMLDGLRATDPATRHVRKEMRRVEAAIQQLGHRHGRTPNEREVADALGLEVGDYQRILQDAHGYVLISLEDLGGGVSASAYLKYCAVSHVDPLVVLERAGLRQALASAIEVLPRQKRQLLRHYYEDDLKMHEIGKQLGLSVSRVSQLHSQTIAELRASILDAKQHASLLKPRVKARKTETSVQACA